MLEHQQIQQSKKPDTIFQKQATPVVQTPVPNPYSIIQRAKVNPRSLTRADIMQLQRTIGNRAVGKLLSGIGSSSTAQQAIVQRQEIPEEEEPLQGKMIGTIQRQEISEEEEPLQGKMAKTIQRQETPEEEEPLQGKMAEAIQRQEIPEEEEPLQGKMIEPLQLQEIPEEEGPLQGKFTKTVQRQEISEEEEPLQTKRENNTGMPDNLKAGVENLSGIDMSDVKVHYNSSKPAEVGALAYTQGTDIHVAPGQERHLPHESWHVVQQKQGRVQATVQMKEGVPVNDDVGLEREADVMGAKALVNAAQFQGALEEQERLQVFASVQRTGQEREALHIKSSPALRPQADIANVYYRQEHKIASSATGFARRKSQTGTASQVADNRSTSIAERKFMVEGERGPATTVSQLHSFTSSFSQLPFQMARRGKKLTPNAEANRQRLLAKRRRKYEEWKRIRAAETEFHSISDSDGVGIDPHKFPLDFVKLHKDAGKVPSPGTGRIPPGTYVPVRTRTIDEAMERLPFRMRSSESLRKIMSSPDAAHGQTGSQEEVNKGGMQAAMTAWQFAKERGLTDVKPFSAEIDFVGTDEHDDQVPFDPFMSPMAGEGKSPGQADEDSWVGSYFKHTHSKGGDSRTVGVWDKTYTSKEQEKRLKDKISKTEARRDGKTHELRVPLAYEYALEHVMAEKQIADLKAKERRWAEVKKRYNAAQRRKPKEKRISLAEALIEDSPLGAYWRTQV